MLSKQFTILVMIIMLSSIGHSADIEDDDPNRIEEHTYEYYQTARPDEITSTCRLDIMRAYGLGADATSLSEPNELCPSIGSNCCGKRDQERIWQYWHRDRKRQQYYHRTVLKIFKWLLGFGKEWAILAGHIVDDYNMKKRGLDTNNNGNEIRGQKKEDGTQPVAFVNSNKYCFNAASSILKYDYNTREKAESFYYELNQKVEFMENARRSFYCMLCSKEGQDSFIMPLKFSSLYHVVYSTPFCQTIVNWSLNVNYELYNTYNEYISALLKMTTCINLSDGGRAEANHGGAANPDFKSNSPPIPLSRELKKFFSNPLENDNSWSFETCNLSAGSSFGFFWKCLSYCNRFNIAKPDKALDGDIDAMKAIYDYLLPYEEIMEAPSNNFFRDDLTLLKKDIIQNYQLSDRSRIFYKTIVSHIDISDYTTSFFLPGGVDPMEVAKGCPLPISYTFAGVLKALVIAIALVLLF